MSSSPRSTVATSAPVPENQRLEALHTAFPDGGLFAGMDWRWSPRPFPLAPSTVTRLEKLGASLGRFVAATNQLYHRSRKGRTLPPWLARYLDAGKPPGLIASAATGGDYRETLPRVIRPDLLLTDDGFALSEVDSVPGGIGLTGWLNETYQHLGESDVVGGATGMIDGFASIFSPDQAAIDISISKESSDYRPEMEWLAGKLRDRQGDGERWRVVETETHVPDVDTAVYRFFELFDLPNLPAAAELVQRAARGEIELTAPAKPFLEEKLWLALFWMRPLREIWRRELRDSHWRALCDIIPYSWVVDPAPLPHNAVLPRLDIQDFRELGDLSQSERELVLKVSGFSEIGWGSRSVRIGHDLPHDEWRKAVDTAIGDFPERPWLLQEFSTARRVEHPCWDENGDLTTLDGRVRLCPYYFVGRDAKQSIRLGGVLATIVPADKKIIHGMRDAIIVPCRVDPDGY